MKFTKYEAAGNDFIVVDAREDSELRELCLLHAKMWCDRHFGIGADGILVITSAEDAQNQAYMHVINSDGSIAAMCGNGIRCVADYLFKKMPVDTVVLRIETLGGLQQIRRGKEPGTYEVRMSKANVLGIHVIRQHQATWRGMGVDVGNPHCVFEVDSPVDALAQAGRFLATHPEFPDGCNIEFIREIGARSFELTVYERGVGPTLACGTGCVASAVAFSSMRGIQDGFITIHAPGGVLNVVVSKNDTPVLIGPANAVFEGQIC